MVEMGDKQPYPTCEYRPCDGECCAVAEQQRIVGIIERFGYKDYGLGWNVHDLLAAIKERPDHA